MPPPIWRASISVCERAHGMNGNVLGADYFDGTHAQPIPVELRIDGDTLHLRGEGVALRIAVREVRWPERTRHGARIAQLPDGGAVHAHSPADWDRWVQASGLHDSWVVRMQQSWRLVLAATAALVALCAVMYVWGLPLAGRAIVAVTPHSVDQKIGEVAMRAVEDQWLRPSRIPTAEQARLRALFLRAQAQYHMARETGLPELPVQIHFRRSRIGPNAFALPDGSIVFTDELVTLLRGQDDTLVGVFGHELGHVRHRHTMRQIVQSGLLAAATSVALGDFSQWLATAPALLGHLAYSRDFERQADQDAIDLMRANGIRPSVMVSFFDRIAAYRQRSHDDDEDDDRADKADKKGKPSEPDHPTPGNRQPGSDRNGDAQNEAKDDALGIAFSSHPADAERIARFTQADRP